jgi:hypothetical protein
VNHRVEVFVGGAESLQDRAQGIGFRAIRLCPTGGKLDARDGIVAPANADALDTTGAIAAFVLPVASIAALNCAHPDNCI